MSRRIQVIINPAAGQDEPILMTFNSVFQAAGVDWDVSITKQAGDARRLAQQAVAAGVDVVGVYGGDGTVKEAASGVMGSPVPLAIFPGGTGNVMSVELGIPDDLAGACALPCGDDIAIRTVDMGQVGNEYFLLRLGIGLEAAMVEGADREMKARMGNLAYILSAFQALREPQIARYNLTLDGRQVESEGITCIIANSGNVGVAGLSLVSTIRVDDGLLDVIVIRKADLSSLLALAASVVRGDEAAEPLQHWRAREVAVATDPPQTVQADGEILGRTPVRAKIIPQAVRIIVPEGLGGG